MWCWIYSTWTHLGFSIRWTSPNRYWQETPQEGVSSSSPSKPKLSWFSHQKHHFFTKSTIKQSHHPFFLICPVRIRFKSILHCFYKNKNTKNFWLFWLFCLCYCFWTGQKRVFWNPLRESTDHCLNQPPSTIHIRIEQTKRTEQTK